MELRSRNLPPQVERANQTESPTQQASARPPSHTEPFSFNPFLSPGPDDHRPGHTSPTRSILNSPDPFEGRNLRGWTNLNADSQDKRPSDFEDNLRDYLEDSPLDRFSSDRRWQPEREASFRPIPRQQESQTYQEHSWQPLVQHPKPIKTSISWENDYRPEPAARQVEWEQPLTRGRMDTMSSPPFQDQRPLGYNRPDHHLSPGSPSRHMGEPASLALTRGRPEQRFEKNIETWRPQRQPINSGRDRVFIQNDFKPRPPSFDGKPDTWEPFLMQLKLMARSYGWSDIKFREQLMFPLGEKLYCLPLTCRTSLLKIQKAFYKPWDSVLGSACLLKPTELTSTIFGNNLKRTFSNTVLELADLCPGPIRVCRELLCSKTWLSSICSGGFQTRS